MIPSDQENSVNSKIRFITGYNSQLYSGLNGLVTFSGELESVDEDQLPVTFFWKRGEVPLESTGRIKITQSKNAIQLALDHVQRDDAGHYTLYAKTKSGDMARKDFELIVEDRSTGDDPPIFLRRLADLSVKVGTRTRLLVEIRSSTDVKVTWYRNDRRICENERIKWVNEGNFYCLEIAPITLDDGGQWMCMAENLGGRNSCISHLNVLVPKAYKSPEFVEELRALLTEQGIVSLECKVIGVPTPVLRWFKDSKEIKAGDVFALTANPDDPTSLGTYTCEAVNCMGKMYSSSKVHVAGRGSREGSLKPADNRTHNAPPPIFTTELRNATVKIGDPVLLGCQVAVPPWPKSVVWYNKTGRVETNEKYRLIEDGLGVYMIEIKPSESCDEGEWKCVVTSNEGSVGISSCVVEMEIPRNYRKPRFMESLKAVLTEEGLVSFECKVVGFPTPQLKWFKDGHELKPGDVYQLTGHNSLGTYCCIARNCMGESSSTAVLTVEDIQNQLNDEERLQLVEVHNQPPKFLKGLKSCETKINEEFRFTVQVTSVPEPVFSWFRDDLPIEDSERYIILKETLGSCHVDIRRVEFNDQAEWKCVATNDFGQSVTSCFLKLQIPRHFKKPRFLECLRAVLSEEGAVNLECKVIGVPQPVLKWYKDSVELKPGDIHRIITGQDGTCCLGTYTCEARNCMGIVASSASLLGIDDAYKAARAEEVPKGQEIQRNISLSTINEERTSQMYDTCGDVTIDDRGDISFSFDGKEVSVSLYETPDLTEEEALQIVEMYADQISEHVTEQNVVELPPLRFVKETSTSGNLLMEAVVIDVAPDYFNPEEDLRTEADMDDISEVEQSFSMKPDELALDRETEEYVKKTYEALDNELEPKQKKHKGDSLLSGDLEEYFSLSHKSEDDTETDLQTFASAKDHLTDSKVPELDDLHVALQEAQALIEADEKLEEVLQQPPEPKPRKRKSKSNEVSQQEEDANLRDISGEEGDGLVVKRSAPAHQQKSVEQLVSILRDLNTIKANLKAVEEEVQLQSGLMMSAASVDRSLGIIQNVLDPITKIQNKLNLYSENIPLENLFESIVEPLQKLEQSLSVIEKCVEMDESGRTLVQRTSVCIVDSSGELILQSLDKIKKVVFALHQPRLRKEVDLIIHDMEVGIEITQDTIRSQALMQEAVALETAQHVSETIARMQEEVQTPTDITALETVQSNLPEDAKDLKNVCRPVVKIQQALENIEQDFSMNGNEENAYKNLQNAVINKLTEPIEDLKKEILTIERMAAERGGDQSLEQTIKFAILDSVKPPLYELQKGLELLLEQSPDAIKSTNVLDSMILPLQEIQYSLVRIGQDLESGTLKSGSPPIETFDNQKLLQSIAQAVINFDTNVQSIKLKILDQNLGQSLTELKSNLSKVIENSVEAPLDKYNITILENIKQPLDDINYCLRQIEAKSLTGSLNDLLDPLIALNERVKMCENILTITKQKENNPNMAVLQQVRSVIGRIELGIEQNNLKLDEEMENVESQKVSQLLNEAGALIAQKEQPTIENLNLLEHLHQCLSNIQEQMKVEKSVTKDKPQAEAFSDAISAPLKDIIDSVVDIQNEILSNPSNEQNNTILEHISQPVQHIVETIMKISQQTQTGAVQPISENLEALEVLTVPLNELKETIDVAISRDQGSTSNMLGSIQHLYNSVSQVIDTIKVEPTEAATSSSAKLDDKQTSKANQLLENIKISLLQIKDSSLEPHKLEILEKSIKDFDDFVNTTDKNLASTSSDYSSLSFLTPLNLPLHEIQNFISEQKLHHGKVDQIHEPILKVIEFIEKSQKDIESIQAPSIKANVLEELNRCVAAIQQIQASKDQHALSDASILKDIAEPIESIEHKLSEIQDAKTLSGVDELSVEENVSLLKTLISPILEIQNTINNFENLQAVEGLTSTPILELFESVKRIEVNVLQDIVQLKDENDSNLIKSFSESLQESLPPKIIQLPTIEVMETESAIAPSSASQSGLLGPSDTEMAETLVPQAAEVKSILMSLNQVEKLVEHDQSLIEAIKAPLTQLQSDLSHIEENIKNNESTIQPIQELKANIEMVREQIEDKCVDELIKEITVCLGTIDKIPTEMTSDLIVEEMKSLSIPLARLMDCTLNIKSNLSVAENSVRSTNTISSPLSDVKKQLDIISSHILSMKTNANQANVVDKFIEPLEELKNCVKELQQKSKDSNDPIQLSLEVSKLRKPVQELNNILIRMTSVEGEELISTEPVPTAEVLGPIKEMQKCLLAIQNQLIMEPDDNTISETTTFVESYVEPILELQRGLEIIETDVLEKVVDNSEISKADLDILRSIVEPPNKDLNVGEEMQNVVQESIVPVEERPSDALFADNASKQEITLEIQHPTATATSMEINNEVVETRGIASSNDPQIEKGEIEATKPEVQSVSKLEATEKISDETTTVVDPQMEIINDVSKTEVQSEAEGKVHPNVESSAKVDLTDNVPMEIEQPTVTGLPMDTITNFNQPEEASVMHFEAVQTPTEDFAPMESNTETKTDKEQLQSESVAATEPLTVVTTQEIKEQLSTDNKEDEIKLAEGTRIENELDDRILGIGAQIVEEQAGQIILTGPVIPAEHIKEQRNIEKSEATDTIHMEIEQPTVTGTQMETNTDIIKSEGVPDARPPTGAPTVEEQSGQITQPTPIESKLGEDQNEEKSAATLTDPIPGITAEQIKEQPNIEKSQATNTIMHMEIEEPTVTGTQMETKTDVIKPERVPDAESEATAVPINTISVADETSKESTAEDSKLDMLTEKIPTEEIEQPLDTILLIDPVSELATAESIDTNVMDISTSVETVSKLAKSEEVSTNEQIDKTKQTAELSSIGSKEVVDSKDTKLQEPDVQIAGQITEVTALTQPPEKSGTGTEIRPDLSNNEAKAISELTGESHGATDGGISIVELAQTNVNDVHISDIINIESTPAVEVGTFATTEVIKDNKPISTIASELPTDDRSATKSIAETVATAVTDLTMETTNDIAYNAQITDADVSEISEAPMTITEDIDSLMETSDYVTLTEDAGASGVTETLDKDKLEEKARLLLRQTEERELTPQEWDNLQYILAQLKYLGSEVHETLTDAKVINANTADIINKIKEEAQNPVKKNEDFPTVTTIEDITVDTSVPVDDQILVEDSFESRVQPVLIPGDTSIQNVETKPQFQIESISIEDDVSQVCVDLPHPQEIDELGNKIIRLVGDENVTIEEMENKTISIGGHVPVEKENIEIIASDAAAIAAETIVEIKSVEDEFHEALLRTDAQKTARKKSEEPDTLTFYDAHEDVDRLREKELEEINILASEIDDQGNFLLTKAEEFVLKQTTEAMDTSEPLDEVIDLITLPPTEESVQQSSEAQELIEAIAEEQAVLQTLSEKVSEISEVQPTDIQEELLFKSPEEFTTDVSEPTQIDSELSPSQIKAEEDFKIIEMTGDEEPIDQDIVTAFENLANITEPSTEIINEESKLNEARGIAAETVDQMIETLTDLLQESFGQPTEATSQETKLGEEQNVGESVAVITDPGTDVTTEEVKEQPSADTVEEVSKLTEATGIVDDTTEHVAEIAAELPEEPSGQPTEPTSLETKLGEEQNVGESVAVITDPGTDVTTEEVKEQPSADTVEEVSKLTEATGIVDDTTEHVAEIAAELPEEPSGQPTEPTSLETKLGEEQNVGESVAVITDPGTDVTTEEVKEQPSADTVEEVSKLTEATGIVDDTTEHVAEIAAELPEEPSGQPTELTSLETKLGEEQNVGESVAVITDPGTDVTTEEVKEQPSADTVEEVSKLTEATGIVDDTTEHVAEIAAELPEEPSGQPTEPTSLETKLGEEQNVGESVAVITDPGTDVTTEEVKEQPSADTVEEVSKLTEATGIVDDTTEHVAEIAAELPEEPSGQPTELTSLETKLGEEQNVGESVAVITDPGTDVTTEEVKEQPSADTVEEVSKLTEATGIVDDTTEHVAEIAAELPEEPSGQPTEPTSLETKLGEEQNVGESVAVITDPGTDVTTEEVKEQPSADTVEEVSKLTEATGIVDDTTEHVAEIAAELPEEPSGQPTELTSLETKLGEEQNVGESVAVITDPGTDVTTEEVKEQPSADTVEEVSKLTEATGIVDDTTEHVAEIAAELPEEPSGQPTEPTSLETKLGEEQNVGESVAVITDPGTDVTTEEVKEQPSADTVEEVSKLTEATGIVDDTTEHVAEIAAELPEEPSGQPTELTSLETKLGEEQNVGESVAVITDPGTDVTTEEVKEQPSADTVEEVSKLTEATGIVDDTTEHVAEIAAELPEEPSGQPTEPTSLETKLGEEQNVGESVAVITDPGTDVTTEEVKEQPSADTVEEVSKLTEATGIVDDTTEHVAEIAAELPEEPSGQPTEPTSLETKLGEEQNVGESVAVITDPGTDVTTEEVKEQPSADTVEEVSKLTEATGIVDDTTEHVAEIAAELPEEPSGQPTELTSLETKLGEEQNVGESVAVITDPGTDVTTEEVKEQPSADTVEEVSKLTEATGIVDDTTEHVAEIAAELPEEPSGQPTEPTSLETKLGEEQNVGESVAVITDPGTDVTTEEVKEQPSADTVEEVSKLTEATGIVDDTTEHVAEIAAELPEEPSGQPTELTSLETKLGEEQNVGESVAVITDPGTDVTTEEVKEQSSADTVEEESKLTETTGILTDITEQVAEIVSALPEEPSGQPTEPTSLETKLGEEQNVGESVAVITDPGTDVTTEEVKEQAIADTVEEVSKLTEVTGTVADTTEQVAEIAAELPEEPSGQPTEPTSLETKLGEEQNVGESVAVITDPGTDVTTEEVKEQAIADTVEEVSKLTEVTGTVADTTEQVAEIAAELPEEPSGQPTEPTSLETKLGEEQNVGESVAVITDPGTDVTTEEVKEQPSADTVEEVSKLTEAIGIIADTTEQVAEIAAELPEEPSGQPTEPTTLETKLGEEQNVGESVAVITDPGTDVTTEEVKEQPSADTVEEVSKLTEAIGIIADTTEQVAEIAAELPEEPSGQPTELTSLETKLGEEQNVGESVAVITDPGTDVTTEEVKEQSSADTVEEESKLTETTGILTDITEQVAEIVSALPEEPSGQPTEPTSLETKLGEEQNVGESVAVITDPGTDVTTEEVKEQSSADTVEEESKLTETTGILTDITEQVAEIVSALPEESSGQPTKPTAIETKLGEEQNVGETVAVISNAGTDVTTEEVKEQPVVEESKLTEATGIVTDVTQQVAEIVSALPEEPSGQPTEPTSLETKLGEEQNVGESVAVITDPGTDVTTEEVKEQAIADTVEEVSKLTEVTGTVADTTEQVAEIAAELPEEPSGQPTEPTSLETKLGEEQNVGESVAVITDPGTDVTTEEVKEQPSADTVEEVSKLTEAIGIIADTTEQVAEIAAELPEEPSGQPTEPTTLETKLGEEQNVGESVAVITDPGTDVTTEEVKEQPSADTVEEVSKLTEAIGIIADTTEQVAEIAAELPEEPSGQPTELTSLETKLGEEQNVGESVAVITDPGTDVTTEEVKEQSSADTVEEESKLTETTGILTDITEQVAEIVSALPEEPSGQPTEPTSLETKLGEEQNVGESVAVITDPGTDVTTEEVKEQSSADTVEEESKLTETTGILTDITEQVAEIVSALPEEPSGQPTEPTSLETKLGEEQNVGESVAVIIDPGTDVTTEEVKEQSSADTVEEESKLTETTGILTDITEQVAEIVSALPEESSGQPTKPTAIETKLGEEQNVGETVAVISNAGTDVTTEEVKEQPVVEESKLTEATGIVTDVTQQVAEIVAELPEEPSGQPTEPTSLETKLCEQNVGESVAVMTDPGTNMMTEEVKEQPSADTVGEESKLTDVLSNITKQVVETVGELLDESSAEVTKPTLLEMHDEQGADEIVSTATDTGICTINEEVQTKIGDEEIAVRADVKEMHTSTEQKMPKEETSQALETLLPTETISAETVQPILDESATVDSVSILNAHNVETLGDAQQTGEHLSIENVQFATEIEMITAGGIPEDELQPIDATELQSTGVVPELEADQAVSIEEVIQASQPVEKPKRKPKTKPTEEVELKARSQDDINSENVPEEVVGKSKSLDEGQKDKDTPVVKPKRKPKSKSIDDSVKVEAEDEEPDAGSDTESIDTVIEMDEGVQKPRRKSKGNQEDVIEEDSKEKSSDTVTEEPPKPVRKSKQKPEETLPSEIVDERTVVVDESIEKPSEPQAEAQPIVSTEITSFDSVSEPAPAVDQQVQRTIEPRQPTNEQKLEEHTLIESIPTESQQTTTTPAVEAQSIEPKKPDKKPRRKTKSIKSEEDKPTEESHKTEESVPAAIVNETEAAKPEEIIVASEEKSLEDTVAVTKDISKLQGEVAESVLEVLPSAEEKPEFLIEEVQTGVKKPKRKSSKKLDKEKDDSAKEDEPKLDSVFVVKPEETTVEKTSVEPQLEITAPESKEPTAQDQGIPEPSTDEQKVVENLKETVEVLKSLEKPTETPEDVQKQIQPIEDLHQNQVIAEQTQVQSIPGEVVETKSEEEPKQETDVKKPKRKSLKKLDKESKDDKVQKESKDEAKPAGGVEDKTEKSGEATVTKAEEPIAKDQTVSDPGVDDQIPETITLEETNKIIVEEKPEKTLVDISSEIQAITDEPKLELTVDRAEVVEVKSESDDHAKSHGIKEELAVETTEPEVKKPKRKSSKKLDKESESTQAKDEHTPDQVVETTPVLRTEIKPIEIEAATEETPIEVSESVAEERKPEPDVKKPKRKSSKNLNKDEDTKPIEEESQGQAIIEPKQDEVIEVKPVLDTEAKVDIAPEVAPKEVDENIKKVESHHEAPDSMADETQPESEIRKPKCKSSKKLDEDLKDLEAKVESKFDEVVDVKDTSNVEIIADTMPKEGLTALEQMNLPEEQPKVLPESAADEIKPEAEVKKPRRKSSKKLEDEASKPIEVEVQATIETPKPNDVLGEEPTKTEEAPSTENKSKENTEVTKPKRRSTKLNKEKGTKTMEAGVEPQVSATSLPIDEVKPKKIGDNKAEEIPATTKEDVIVTKAPNEVSTLAPETESLSVDILERKSETTNSVEEKQKEIEEGKVEPEVKKPRRKSSTKLSKEEESKATDENSDEKIIPKPAQIEKDTIATITAVEVIPPNVEAPKPDEEEVTKPRRRSSTKLGKDKTKVPEEAPKTEDKSITTAVVPVIDAKPEEVVEPNEPTIPAVEEEKKKPEITKPKRKSSTKLVKEKDAKPKEPVQEDKPKEEEDKITEKTPDLVDEQKIEEPKAELEVKKPRRKSSPKLVEELSETIQANVSDITAKPSETATTPVEEKPKEVEPEITKPKRRSSTKLGKQKEGKSPDIGVDHKPKEEVPGETVNDDSQIEKIGLPEVTPPVVTDESQKEPEVKKPKRKSTTKLGKEKEAAAETQKVEVKQELAVDDKMKSAEHAVDLSKTEVPDEEKPTSPEEKPKEASPPPPQGAPSVDGKPKQPEPEVKKPRRKSSTKLGKDKETVDEKLKDDLDKNKPDTLKDKTSEEKVVTEEEPMKPRRKSLKKDEAKTQEKTADAEQKEKSEDAEAKELKRKSITSPKAKSPEKKLEEQKTAEPESPADVKVEEKFEEAEVKKPKRTKSIKREEPKPEVVEPVPEKPRRRPKEVPKEPEKDEEAIQRLLEATKAKILAENQQKWEAAQQSDDDSSLSEPYEYRQEKLDKLVEQKQSRRVPQFETYLMNSHTEQGGKVKLLCNILGKDVKVMWKKDNKVIENSAKYRIKEANGLHTIEILDAKPSDSGEYQCTAYNPNGEMYSSAHVEVYEPPPKEVKIPPTFTRSIKGESEVLVVAANRIGWYNFYV